MWKQTILNKLNKLKHDIVCLFSRVQAIEENCCDGGGGTGIQSIQEGDNISIDNTDPQNPIISALGGGGGTPTLSEVLAEGNVADTDIIFDTTNFNRFSFRKGSTFLGEIYEDYNYNIGGTSIHYVSFDPDFKFVSLFSKGIATNQDDIRIISTYANPAFKGLQGHTYYGANYNDNTYVQKKYVDDNTMINPTLITGYNAGATQTLKNISGVLTWVTD